MVLSDRLLASNITHLPFGPVSSFTYGNGLPLTKGYDLDYRLARQSVGSLMDFNYTYDAGGNLQTVQDLITVANNQSYGYDPVNRLISATGTNALAYSYDAVGNRVSDYNGTQSTQFNYDLSSQKLLSQTGSRSGSLTLDANGNTTQSHGNSYNYAPDQRLASVAQNSTTLASYNYDTQGQRISKTTLTGTVNYDYDLQGHVLSESDTPANYVYLDGEPLARVGYNTYDSSGNVTGWPIAYYHNNQIGAPLTATDIAGAVAWTGQLDPFGAMATVNPNITQNLRFPGQYADQETGLHYNMQRYYDPTIGRYLQSDPIGLLGGINTYGYVGGNPVNLSDPLGLIVEWYGQESEIKLLKSAYEKLKTTSKGLELCNKLENSPDVYSITNKFPYNIPGFKPEKSFYYNNLIVKIITVDPTYQPKLNTTKGSRRVSTVVVLGHEIGHAATGIEDDGPSLMNNVNENENPIRQELGLPNRTSYP